MKATIEPTPELYDAPINGVKVPVRIWKGTTEGGVAIEAYVLSITPDNDADAPRLKVELPAFVRPSRETFTIDTSERSADARSLVGATVSGIVDALWQAYLLQRPNASRVDFFAGAAGLFAATAPALAEAADSASGDELLSVFARIADELAVVFADGQTREH